jgi:hypothetical protein
MDTHAPELLTMVPNTRFSRRGFVMTSLASGFALATGPVSAETITTDTRRAARLQCRLSAELQRRRGKGCLGADARLVQEIRRRVTPVFRLRSNCGIGTQPARRSL